jgi:hypothetical protein
MRLAPILSTCHHGAKKGPFSWVKITRIQYLTHEKVKSFLAEAGIGVKDKRERDIAIYLLWETGWYENREIGEAFGLSYSGVSRRVKVTKDRIERDKDFRKRYQRIKAQIKM